MNIQQKGITTLIKSALTGQKYTLPEQFSLNEAAETANKHGIGVMLYYGALNCGMDSNSAIMQQLFMNCCFHISKSEGQMFEIKKLLDIFSENGIDTLPLKGTILKNIYPKTEMRRMGDADILIKESQYPDIKNILKNIGYIFEYETDHEIVWKKPALNLELHKKLIPERNKEFYAYFGSGWDFACKKNGDGYIYEFSKEHTMMYLFTHLAKHYSGSGIGIQHMTDLWIYKLKNPDLNNDYIIKELKKLCLDKFYINVMHTLDVWFEDAVADSMSDFITEFIFSCGVYGSHTNRILAIAARETRYNNGKKSNMFKKIVRAIFPSAETLKVYYPILKTKSFLLPIIWVKRWFKILFFEKNKISAKSADIKNTTNEKVDIYQQALEFVGLDFNFKE